MKKKLIYILYVILILCILSTCSKEDTNDDGDSNSGGYIYDTTNDDTEDKTTEEVITETETTEEITAEEISTEENIDTTTTEENIGEEDDMDTPRYEFNSMEAISLVCGLKSSVEKKIAYCCVETDTDHNPYDVVYDYGEEYNEYVDACDWSLVFDADYYMETFPMLALLYHYDEDLLLEHFQTVGIHEGRQGCATFNVSAYATNGSKELWDIFGKNYEGYYLYYMLNYESEKDIDTVNNRDGSPTLVQYRQILTALQAGELKAANEYRAEVGAQPLVFDSEFAAFANYRAYLNSAEGWSAHEWCNQNLETLYSYMNIIEAPTYSENTVTTTGYGDGELCADNYADSPDHYEAMVDTRFFYMGVSNVYNAKERNRGSQFDVFTIDLNTPTHN